jgi:hypothetical protein
LLPYPSIETTANLKLTTSIRRNIVENPSWPIVI